MRSLCIRHQACAKHGGNTTKNNKESNNKSKNNEEQNKQQNKQQNKNSNTNKNSKKRKTRQRKQECELGAACSYSLCACHVNDPVVWSRPAAHDCRAALLQISKEMAPCSAL